MKRVLSILLSLSVLCLSGCNNTSTSSDVDSTSQASETSKSDDTVSETSEGTTQSEESTDTISSDSSISGELDNTLTEYESLIYSDTSKICVADICELEIPRDVAQKCVPVEDAMERMEELTGSEQVDDITPEFWKSLFHNLAYCLNYHEVGMLMSEELLLQINLFTADENTSAMMTVLADTDEVSTFNSIFGKIVATSLYGTSGFSSLVRAGTVSQDDVSALSFIFACDTQDESFSLTDGYFGYFIVGYSAKTDTLMTCLISGLADISDPLLIREVYESFNSPSEDSKYWAVLERRKDD